MTQAEIFTESEGNKWHERNRDKPRLPDPVLETIRRLDLRPQNVLELGCGTGWRLAEIKPGPKRHCRGYDPSEEAVKARVFEHVYKATALEALRLIAGGFYDIIIFGFCLYLVDREELLLIAGHADRALKDGGHIVIHDFVPEYSYKRTYEHKAGLWSFKMDHSKLWLSHPSYRLVEMTSTGEDDERVGVAVLKKDMSSGFPVREP